MNKFMAWSIGFIGVFTIIAVATSSGTPSTPAPTPTVNQLKGEVYTTLVSIQIQNNDTVTWNSCTAVLNSEYKIVLAPLAAGKTVNLPYREFTKGLAGQERFDNSTTKPTVVQVNCKDPEGVLIGAM